MKKIILILSFIFLSIGIFGCRQNNEKKVDTTSSNTVEKITYYGEAEYWKATIVNEVSKGSYESDFTLSIEYKGDLRDLKDIHQISYIYKYGIGERKRSENAPEGLSPKKGAIVYQDNSRIDNGYVNEQTVIPFKIEWNDNVEEFELKYSK
ncbi:hypothetical protein A8F94_14825 [Bacillus sp. FJAT-27225]|uniref:hypothetical protein n=1 Tax=Bacillus sp. FJAT-27225 TaxID=1743144 RepID=UPI00080C2166|nr:hypothetical protein [Bacillus sp. FJAT-27225]OCA84008.1 hypothetical protein A8F94_14825 [Bacillus sp. FJAT-27225]